MFTYKDQVSRQAQNLTDHSASALPWTNLLPDKFKIFSITNRQICQGSLPQQIDKLCRLGVKDFILREKDLSPKDYASLAAEVLKVCQKHRANLILHSFWQIADDKPTGSIGQWSDCKLTCDKVHFPLWLLERDHAQIVAKGFTEIGCSCHSIEEAQRAIDLGATYITASHIYPTDCKKGLAPRGLEFLNDICSFVKSQKGNDFPVYALGGIKTDGSQFEELKAAGASGACLMSGLMKL